MPIFIREAEKISEEDKPCVIDRLPSSPKKAGA